MGIADSIDLNALTSTIMINIYYTNYCRPFYIPSRFNFRLIIICIRSGASAILSLCPFCNHCPLLVDYTNTQNKQMIWINERVNEWIDEYKSWKNSKLKKPESKYDGIPESKDDGIPESKYDGILQTCMEQERIF